MPAEAEGSTTLNLGVGGDTVREYIIHLADGTLVRQQIVSLADSSGRQLDLGVATLLTQILDKLEEIRFQLEIK